MKKIIVLILIFSFIKINGETNEDIINAFKKIEEARENAIKDAVNEAISEHVKAIQDAALKTAERILLSAIENNKNYLIVCESSGTLKDLTEKEGHTHIARVKNPNYSGLLGGKEYCDIYLIS